MQKFFGKCVDVALKVLIFVAPLLFFGAIIGAGMFYLGWIVPRQEAAKKAAEKERVAAIEQKWEREAKEEVDAYLAAAVRWRLLSPDFRKEVEEPQKEKLGFRAKKLLEEQLEHRFGRTAEGRKHREEIVARSKEEKTATRKELAERMGKFLKNYGWFFATKEISWVEVLSVDEQEWWWLDEMADRLNKPIVDRILQITKEVKPLEDRKVGIFLSDYGTGHIHYFGSHPKLGDSQIQFDTLRTPILEAAQSYGDIKLEGGIWHPGSEVEGKKERSFQVLFGRPQERLERTYNATVYSMPTLLPKDEKILIAVQVSPTAVRVTLSGYTIPIEDDDLRSKITAIAAVARVNVTKEWRWMRTNDVHSHDLVPPTAK